MATSQTHPPHSIPPHMRHTPRDAPRPHTAPHHGLVPRDFSPHDTAYHPMSLQHQTLAPPSLSHEKHHHSLPTDPQNVIPPQQSASSVATLENARYIKNDIPRPEHPNEDRHFSLEEEDFKVFGVFDGHDGPRAAGFASNYFIEYFNTDSWKSLISLPPQVQREQIPMALREFFKAAEKEFFSSIRSSIDERNQLQRTIPADMNSYQAYLTYPVEVARLQELEPKIAGGTTVVLAVVCGKTLYIANAGDSRAVLVNENEKGIQQIVQLSEDHGIDNIDELKRLVDLGLDRDQLQRAGRLGSHENTRSIGDYSIKGGYKDVDTLRHCKKQPGLCDPHIDIVPITPHCKYIMLMTDGVYKSIEAPFAEKASIDTNKVLMSIVNREKGNLPSRKRAFDVLADRVVDRIRAIHEDAYKTHAAKDVRSPIAVSCRKRDDMTLLIHQFERGSVSRV